MPVTVNTNIINDANGYSLDAQQVKGTLVVVQTIAQRNAIYKSTLVNGSLCYVSDPVSEADKGYWIYDATTESWNKQEFDSGISSEDVTIPLPPSLIITATRADNPPLTIVMTRNAGSEVTYNIAQGQSQEIPVSMGDVVQLKLQHVYNNTWAFCDFSNKTGSFNNLTLNTVGPNDPYYIYTLRINGKGTADLEYYIEEDE